MRVLFGLIVFVIGYVFLGLLASGKIELGWDFGKNAKEIEDYLATEANSKLGATAQGITTTVSGRDIVASGLASSAEEKAVILANLDDTRGRRIVVDQIDLLAVASPYQFNATKSDIGISYAGNAPTDVALLSVVRGSSGSFDLATGMPDTEWPTVVGTGMGALATLEGGQFELLDRTARLTGTAESLSDRDAIADLFANLPDGYEATIEIEVLPTKPYVFSGTKTATQTEFNGYVPSAEAAVGFKSALGPNANLEAKLGMPDAQWPSIVFKGASALDRLTLGQMDIVDKTLRITGEAANLEIAESIKASLSPIPEGYTLKLDIDVKPVEVYTFYGVKTDTGQTFDGFVPDLATRDEFTSLIGDQAARLKLAAGVPDASWLGFVKKGVAGLDAMQSGKLSMVDRQMTLTGKVADPEAAEKIKSLIGQAPDDYDLSFDLVAIDDGKPIEVLVEYNEKIGSTVSGKAPRDVTASSLAQGLGIPSLADDLQISDLDGSVKVMDRFERIGRWIPSFQSATLAVTPDATKLDAVLKPGKSCVLDAMKTKLAEQLGSNVSVTLQLSPDEPANGATRVNTTTGKSEIYDDCFWKPAETTETTAAAPETSVADTTQPASSLLTAAICTQRTQTIIGTQRINFLSSKAELDKSSLDLIDALADTIKPCLAAGASLEVGGHTDSSGSADFNQRLSLQRATAVVDAFTARGVSPARISAKGYGETQPIATNETDEGKAQNRRTTFNWSDN